MNPIEVLKEEHKQIERELLELEAIMEASEINYPNLLHVFKNLHQLWDLHEEKEEIFFPELEKEKIIIPIQKMLFQHKDLREHKDAIYNALKAASEVMMKEALENHGKIIIQKLREHINFEDEVLYTIAVEEIGDGKLEEIWNAMNL